MSPQTSQFWHGTTAGMSVACPAILGRCSSFSSFCIVESDLPFVVVQVFARHLLQPHKFFFGSCVDTFLNGSYFCEYQPTITGPYMLNVTLDNAGNVTVPTAHISGSPFSVVISFGSLRPEHCVATGAGIRVSYWRQVFARFSASICCFRLPECPRWLPGVV